MNNGGGLATTSVMNIWDSMYMKLMHCSHGFPRAPGWSLCKAGWTTYGAKHAGGFYSYAGVIILLRICLCFLEKASYKYGAMQAPEHATQKDVK